MRLLVTRPAEDARETAEALRTAGHEVVVEPMLTPRPLATEIPTLDVYQALLFTSRNGVRTFAEASGARGLSVYAVGDATAKAARHAGFAAVASASGDAGRLAALVQEQLTPSAGKLLHATGREGSGTLETSLRGAGFDVVRLELYEAVPAAGLSKNVRTRLETGSLDAIVFFSPRTAHTFGTLVSAANLAKGRAKLTAYCLSPAVAEAAGQGWARKRIAKQPNQAALLALIASEETHARGHQATMAEQDTEKEPVTGGEMAETDASQEGRDKATSPEAANPAEEVIQRFGGLRPMANKLQIAVSTVQGWKARGHIPAARHEDILAAARKHAIDVSEADLAAATETASDSAQRPWSPETIKDRAGDDRAPSPRGSAEGTGTAQSATTALASAKASSDSASGRVADTSAEAGAAASTARGSSGSGLGMGMVLGAGILILGLGAAVVSRDLWLPMVDGGASGTAAQDIANLQSRVTRLEERPQAPDLAQPLNELRTRVEALEGQVAELAKSLAETPTQGAEASSAVTGQIASQLNDFGTQLGQLGQRLADLEASTDVEGELTEIKQTSVNLRERVSDLDGKLAQLREAQQQAGASEARAAALALALGQLREALRFSAPYTEQLKGIAALAGESGAAAIGTLEAHAATGVPTLDDLTASFPEMAGDVVAASYGEGEEGWVAGIVRRASKVVSVRRVGDVEGDSASAIVARSESKLAGGDLSGAVTELESLQGEPAAAAAGWLAQAKTRLDTEAAMADLIQQAIGRLAPTES
jgi:uroporphyrinogen-III synthase